MILDLRDKISIEDALAPKETAFAESSSGEALGGNRNEAIEALVALGYSSSDALRAVKQVSEAEAGSVEDILKAALKYIF